MKNILTPVRAVPREELEVSGMRVIEDKRGNIVAYVPFDEDAEEIALSVNCREDLVDAACKALPYVEEATRDPAYKPGSVKAAIAIIRAALIKADALKK